MASLVQGLLDLELKIMIIIIRDTLISVLGIGANTVVEYLYS